MELEIFGTTLTAPDINLIVSIMILGFMAYRHLITKSIIQGLKDQFEMAKGVNSMIDIESIKAAHKYQVQIIKENSESNMADLLKAHQDLTNRYEELLIMPLNIMKTSGSPEIEKAANDMLDTYPLNAPIVRKRLKEVQGMTSINQ
jgi:hypothetical protein